MLLSSTVFRIRTPAINPALKLEFEFLFYLSLSLSENSAIEATF